MRTGRLEAFSDGVLAIIITVMVLELHKPGQASFTRLWHESGSGLLTYLLSFVYVGIYRRHDLVPITEADYDLDVSGAVSPFDRPGLGRWLKPGKLDE